LAALLIALSSSAPTASKGINPIQHSERTTSQGSTGINPIQHSE
jgi:hypothetical protein